MAQNRSADEELVRALDDQERVATLNRDLPAIERLWSEDLTVNAPNNRVVVGRRAVLDTFVHAGIINFSLFERRIEHIRADGPYVFIMGLETVKPTRDAPSAGLVAGETVELFLVRGCSMLRHRSAFERVEAVCLQRQAVSNERPIL